MRDVERRSHEVAHNGSQTKYSDKVPSVFGRQVEMHLTKPPRKNATHFPFSYCSRAAPLVYSVRVVYSVLHHGTH